MRFTRTVLILILTACIISACGGDSTPAMPKDTLEAYSKAVKKKDTAMIKRLISEASLKLHEQEAAAQNVSLDEIILRDTLFPPDQRVFDYKNEKIEGDTATVEVKNDFDGYDTIYLVKENGIWKIDKKGTSDRILNEVEEAEKKLDDLIKQGKEQEENNQNINQLDLNTNQDLDMPMNDPNNQMPLPNDQNNPQQNDFK